MAKYVIGTDVGTTGTKSILFSEDGQLVAHAYVPYPMQTPAIGYCEQDAEDWWRAVVSTIHTVVKSAHVESEVAAISLSLQGGTLVAVDENCRPLRPAIVWSDKRCDEQRRAFSELFGERYMYEKTGWSSSSGLNAMQIRWLMENEPGTYHDAAMFLSVPDFISLRMTGRAAVDISDAGINQLADIRAGGYDPAILDFCGITEKQLGEILPSGEPIGYLTEEALAECGLTGKVLLVAGAHDQYAGLTGAGVTETGDVLIGTGTAWVVTALTDRPNFESGFAQSVSAVPGRWGSLVSLSTGGVSLDWLRNNIAKGIDDSEKLPYDAINAFAEKAGAGAGGLMFFPYFTSAAYPLKNPNAKAAFIGLDLMHDRYAMARAIMEGVALQTIWTLDAFNKAYGINHLKVSGGATKSPLWTKIIANAANMPVYIPKTPDMPCVGAAVLAGVGAGVFDSVQEGAKRLSVEEKVVEPDPEGAEQYAAILERYQKVAAALSELYNL